MVLIHAVSLFLLFRLGEDISENFALALLPI